MWTGPRYTSYRRNAGLILTGVRQKIKKGKKMICIKNNRPIFRFGKRTFGGYNNKMSEYVNTEEKDMYKNNRPIFRFGKRTFGGYNNLMSENVTAVKYKTSKLEINELLVAPFMPTGTRDTGAIWYK